MQQAQLRKLMGGTAERTPRKRPPVTTGTVMLGLAEYMQFSSRFGCKELFKSNPHKKGHRKTGE
tara:strand:+ start:66 stop:257 length:192 start_codon:yes stop_codon:yes gene_type:complete